MIGGYGNSVGVPTVGGVTFFADEYRDEHLTSAVAAAEGYVDEIVPPADTRRRLTEALRTLEAVAHPAHGVRNIPL